MKIKLLPAPQIDNILEMIHPSQEEKIVNTFLKEKIKRMYLLINDIKPEIQYLDKIWSFWIRAKRGDINEFGSYEEFKEEEMVESYKDFELLWKDYYPDEEKWYKVVFVKYKEELFINIGMKFHLGFDLGTNQISGLGFVNEWIEKLFEWLQSEIEKQIDEIKTDQASYNLFIENNLPYKKRYGKIKRIDLWNGVEDIERLDTKLGDDKIIKLEQLVNEQNKIGIIPQMSAGDFFRYCEICYDANEYFSGSEKKLSPKEKYLAFADGRDEGLRKIPENSPEAFKEWYHGKACGGHPWEICRGGNSTHISLYVSEKDNGWILRLRGESRVRVFETVNMALALYKNNVPFILSYADETLRMVKGTDFIGIVPENVTPRYCHSSFPEEDRIIDFMNLGFEPEISSFITKNAEWYPVKKLSLC